MWGRFDDQITHHPKILKAGVRAAYFFFAGIIYCTRYRTDGYIPKEALPILAPMRDYKRLARALVEVRVPSSAHGLWEEVEGGYRVHDFLVYQPSAAAMAQREEADRKRLRAARSAARSEQGDAPTISEPPRDSIEEEAQDQGARTDELVSNVGTSESQPSFTDAVPVPSKPARRRDVGPTSTRRRPVPSPSPSPSPIPNPSQDPDHVCVPDSRALARDDRHTHTARRDDDASEDGAEPDATESTAESTASELLRHLRAMPPPLCHLATPEHAARFAAAQLTGLGIDDIRRAITAAGLKLGKHADARPDAPQSLAELADHVGSFLANQTPAAITARLEIEAGAIDDFLRRWCVLYAKVEGIEYVVTDEDRRHASEVIALVRQVARERAPRLGVDSSTLEERVAKHWIRAYLRDEGVNQYLAKSHHPLRYLKRGVATYGMPSAPHLQMRESTMESTAAMSAPSGKEIAARGRELLRVLDAGPGLAKALARSDAEIAAAGAG